MQAVLMSIKPKWCELIASGKKTVEVRKIEPKLETPFKCYIYCTKEKTRLNHFFIAPTYENLILNKNIKVGCQVHFFDGIPKNELCTILNGKVIGEFVCDSIDHYTNGFFDEQEERDTEEIAHLLGASCLTYSELCAYAGSKDFYGWQISNLAIYDKPRELREFSKYGFGRFVPLKRPPQSWCYVNI